MDTVKRNFPFAAALILLIMVILMNLNSKYLFTDIFYLAILLLSVIDINIYNTKISTPLYYMLSFAYSDYFFTAVAALITYPLHLLMIKLKISDITFLYNYIIFIINIFICPYFIICYFKKNNIHYNNYKTFQFKFIKPIIFSLLIVVISYSSTFFSHNSKQSHAAIEKAKSIYGTTYNYYIEHVLNNNGIYSYRILAYKDTEIKEILIDNLQNSQ